MSSLLDEVNSERGSMVCCAGTYRCSLDVVTGCAWGGPRERGTGNEIGRGKLQKSKKKKKEEKKKKKRGKNQVKSPIW